MPDCQEVNHIPSCVEGVDDPIIADAEPVAVAAGEMVVRKCAEPQSHFVDLDSMRARVLVGSLKNAVSKRV